MQTQTDRLQSPNSKDSLFCLYQGCRNVIIYMKKSYWKVSLNHSSAVSLHNSRGFLENSRIRDALLGGIAGQRCCSCGIQCKQCQEHATWSSCPWCLQYPGLDLRSISRKHFLWRQVKFPYTLKTFLVLRQGLMVSHLGLDHVEERRKRSKEEIERKQDEGKVGQCGKQVMTTSSLQCQNRA